MTRIHSFGNVLNNAYNITKWLRDDGFDAQVFVDGSGGLEQDLPWWDDREINPNDLPSWIRYYPRLRRHWAGSAERRFMQEFAQCDLAHVWGDGPIWAVRAGVPFVFSSFGWDLEVPFSRIRWRDGLSKLVRGQGVHFGLRSALIAPLQREALAQARAICIVPDMYYQLPERLEPLGLGHLARFVPLAIDTDKYRPQPSAVQPQYDRMDVVFFSPTRHFYGAPVTAVKGNDKLIRAFSRLIYEDLHTSVRLLLARKGPSVQRSAALVRDLELEDRVEWLHEMPRWKLVEYYRLTNVVVCDQFLRDDWQFLFPRSSELLQGLGGVGAEALAFGRPLLTYYKVPEGLYAESPPVFSALTEDQILARMREIMEMSPERRARIGQLGRDWIVRYRDRRVVMKRYEEIYSEAIAQ